MVTQGQHVNNPFEDGSALQHVRGLASFEEAVARLLHTAEHGRPFGVIRGPAGSGKTTVLGLAAEELRGSGQECGQIDLRRTSTEEFAWRMACELDAAPQSIDRSTCWRLIEDTLTGRALSGRTTVLLLDHAGECDAGIIDELKRLMAIVESSAGWCTVLCAARTESHGFDAFANQHGELRIEVGPLDRLETGEFLDRVVVASGCVSFGNDAVRAIHTQTCGRLREIISLSRLVLFAMYAEDVREVTSDIVKLVGCELTPFDSPRLASHSADQRVSRIPPADALTSGR